MARQRLIRPATPLPAEDLLVRALFQTYASGVDFDRDALVADAAYNFELFGYFGLSLWHVSDVWPLERILTDKTRRARRVAMFTAGALQTQGLGLVPSGKAPHYDASHGPVYGSTYANVQITSGSAEELVDRFLAAAYTVEDNPHHQQEPS
ncbi:hypothetical protein [Nocardioides sp. NPDC006273]|uniref:hypothetical protein n=1 Tax=Nocardioides sp. NPDC006273 TaxID=3155598 RepID=UPI0033BD5411